MMKTVERITVIVKLNLKFQCENQVYVVIVTSIKLLVRLKQLLEHD